MIPPTARPAHRAASASLIALIALCVAWEFWLAPLRPGGSWLVLKAMPLFAPLAGILNGRRYTFQWSSLLILLYLLEGLTRAITDTGAMMRLLAGVETALALVFLVAVTIYARQTAPSRLKAGD